MLESKETSFNFTDDSSNDRDHIILTTGGRNHSDLADNDDKIA